VDKIKGRKKCEKVRKNGRKNLHYIEIAGFLVVMVLVNCQNCWKLAYLRVLKRGIGRSVTVSVNFGKYNNRENWKKKTKYKIFLYNCEDGLKYNVTTGEHFKFSKKINVLGEIANELETLRNIDCKEGAENSKHFFTKIFCANPSSFLSRFDNTHII
jgi:hypothetical protein